MNPIYLEAGAVVAVAGAVLLAVTTLALRRSSSTRNPTGPRRAAGGMLAALPTWGGVLVTVLLAARGKVALASIALIATVIHVGITRLRITLAQRRE